MYGEQTPGLSHDRGTVARSSRGNRRMHGRGWKGAPAGMEAALLTLQEQGGCFAAMILHTGNAGMDLNIGTRQGVIGF